MYTLTRGQPDSPTTALGGVAPNTSRPLILKREALNALILSRMGHLGNPHSIFLPWHFAQIEYTVRRRPGYKTSTSIP
jgi:hypothetical protein